MNKTTLTITVTMLFFGFHLAGAQSVSPTREEVSEFYKQDGLPRALSQVKDGQRQGDIFSALLSNQCESHPAGLKLEQCLAAGDAARNWLHAYRSRNAQLGDGQSLKVDERIQGLNVALNNTESVDIFDGQAGPEKKAALPDPTYVRPAARKNEVFCGGSTSFGHYRLFGSANNEELRTGGCEYDHQLGHHFGADVYYVGGGSFELLNQSAKTDGNGHTIGPGRMTVPGVAITPLGFQFRWRKRKLIQPFGQVTANVHGFEKKVEAPSGSNLDYGFIGSGGVNLALGRYDLSVAGCTQHVSNGNTAKDNPGWDGPCVSARLGIPVSGWKAILHRSKNARSSDSDSTDPARQQ